VAPGIAVYEAWFANKKLSSCSHQPITETLKNIDEWSEKVNT
jgi:hypothetical protein